MIYEEEEAEGGADRDDFDQRFCRKNGSELQDGLELAAQGTCPRSDRKGSPTARPRPILGNSYNRDQHGEAQARAEAGDQASEAAIKQEKPARNHSADEESIDPFSLPYVFMSELNYFSERSEWSRGAVCF
jgi:hypothetical protein